MGKAIHLRRSVLRTWCGRFRVGLRVTKLVGDATCKTCLKADAAEDRRNK